MTESWKSVLLNAIAFAIVVVGFIAWASVG